MASSILFKVESHFLMHLMFFIRSLVGGHLPPPPPHPLPQLAVVNDAVMSVGCRRFFELVLSDQVYSGVKGVKPEVGGEHFRSQRLL